MLHQNYSAFLWVTLMTANENPPSDAPNLLYISHIRVRTEEAETAVVTSRPSVLQSSCLKNKVPHFSLYSLTSKPFSLHTDVSVHVNVLHGLLLYLCVAVEPHSSWNNRAWKVHCDNRSMSQPIKSLCLEGCLLLSGYLYFSTSENTWQQCTELSNPR